MSAIVSPHAPNKVSRRTTRVYSTYRTPNRPQMYLFCPRKGAEVKSSQVNTLPKAKSQSKDKRAKDRQ
jgi:hypothetical protein